VNETPCSSEDEYWLYANALAQIESMIHMANRPEQKDFLIGSIQRTAKAALNHEYAEIFGKDHDIVKRHSGESA
jgi:hypothetical protein